MVAMPGRMAVMISSSGLDDASSGDPNPLGVPLLSLETKGIFKLKARHE
jgi:hypothetical protein